MRCHGIAGRLLVVKIVGLRGKMTRAELTALLDGMEERPFAPEFSFDEVIDKLVVDAFLDERLGYLTVNGPAEECLLAIMRQKLQERAQEALARRAATESKP